jgi:hypothetical protein
MYPSGRGPTAPPRLVWLLRLLSYPLITGLTKLFAMGFPNALPPRSKQELISFPPPLLMLEDLDPCLLLLNDILRTLAAPPALLVSV